jgi:pyruvate/2-oxoglutarate/acetoin dehydrogenase E1 component
MQFAKDAAYPTRPPRSTTCSPEGDDHEQSYLTMARAGREALDWEMERRSEIFCLGEDVYNFGGIFGTMDGFGAKYGPERVINTPISETGFIGMAAGAAMAGMHR